MYERQVKISGKGKIVIVHDVRDEIAATVVVAGCRWQVDSLGEPYDNGHAHRLRYAYVQFDSIVEPLVAYAEMRELQRSEEDRWQDQFGAMMEDGDNDGVSAPRRESTVPATIISQIDEPMRREGECRERIASYQHSEHFAKSSAGSRAQKRVDSGVSAVDAAEDMEREWTEWCDKHVD